MVNLTKLQDLSALELNNTLINSSSDDIVPNLIANSDTATGGYLGLVIYIGLFLTILFVANRNDLPINLDIVRSILFASGFTSIFGFVGIASGFTSNFQHVMWFFILFLLTSIWVYLRRKKGD